MGLLDDAIREHLDLKRARGGDPAEIERMEREALGPVRRDPTIGSPRFDSSQEPGSHEYDEPGFHEDHLTDLEELQELGYHDSTAPHLHPHHEHAHPHHEHLDPDGGYDDAHLEHFEPEVEEIEQPRRRFLRRNRPASLSEPAAALDPGFHEQPPIAHHDPVEHPQDYAPREPELAPPPPPHLQFEHPPKRPRFTAEPPSLHPEPGEDHEPPAEPLNAAPAPPAPEAPPPAPARAQPAAEYEHFDEHPAAGPEAQETTEFDVQKHLAETPRGQEEDEDMLEETPDFLQDTPEHDRLWFEQRPPKDFDFNG